MKFLEALKELREKSEKRNFNQTLDLVINLKNFDPRREQVNAILNLSFPYKEKKIAAFLEDNSMGAGVDFVISKIAVNKLQDKEMKKIVKRYDFFIANAKMMPLIARKFGKTLGSAGKMPDPKIGAVLAQETEEIIAAAAKKLEKITKIKAKESSIKLALGKENMKNEELEQNASSAFETILAALPKKEYNIKNVLLKFTMSSPIKVKK